MATKRILLVEGVDDEQVLKCLCEIRGIQELYEITGQKGVERLLENFPVHLKESDIEALGVIVDADTDLAARWQALRDRLIKAEYQNVPLLPDPTGTIVPPPENTLLPRVGIWIMPDNQNKGILEDFLHFLVPEGSPLFEHVKSSVMAIPESERHFSQLAEPKVIIHTWLAWQKKPGKPLGTAITARYLDPEVAQVDVLVSWLNRLFFQQQDLDTN